MEISDQFFIDRCFQLAKKGLGTTYPNPLVGCVIVENNRIIGEGYHRKAGDAHAEVNAINSVSNKNLLANSTLYVNLEPCNHYGKTPPCTDAIIKHSIPKVVIAGKDYNPIVNEKGILHLKNSGVEVNIVERKIAENQLLNKRFFTYHKYKRPYIILKWAESADGFIDDLSPTPAKISNLYSQQLSHKWRTEEQAIWVGKNTVLKDNPKLNARLWHGEENYKIVVDRMLEIPKTYALFKQNKLLVFNELITKEENNIHYIKIDSDRDLIPQILQVLYEREIQSVIVEGGTYTIESFKNLGIWDEIRRITSSNNLLNGIKAPFFNAPLFSQKAIDTDLLRIYQNAENVYLQNTIAQ